MKSLILRLCLCLTTLGAATFAFTACDTPGGALRALGTACAFDAQCQSRMCTASAGGCGLCVEIRGLGEPCGAALTSCSRSAVCSDGTCKSAMKTLGEACERGVKGGNIECDAQLYCAPNADDSTTGTCMPRGVLGGPCDTLVGCALGADCERGVCVVARLGQEGDSCDDRRCDEGLFCGQGTCRVPTLPIGADCGEHIGVEQCEPGLVCELTGGPMQPDGRYALACKARATEGEPCAYSGQCGQGLFCEMLGPQDRRCMRRRPAGEACGFASDCLEGLECRGSVCAEPCQ